MRIPIRRKEIMFKSKDHKKISWYELTNSHSSDLKKKYRINDRQLEQSVRQHLDGASVNERREFYKDVWDSKNKR